MYLIPYKFDKGHPLS